VIQRDIPAIKDDEKKLSLEFEALILTVPRIPANKSNPDQDIRILYQKLSDELRVKFLLFNLLIRIWLHSDSLSTSCTNVLK
jgi:hypothetical protein